MGVNELCACLGVPPCRLLDAELYGRGVEMVDMFKLEKLVAPREGESIADALMRRFGKLAVDSVEASLINESNNRLGQTATS